MREPKGRALSGLSMGGRHTIFVGFNSLDLFANFGVLSAGDVNSEQIFSKFLNDPDVNMLFIRVDPAVADRMAEDGLLFYRMAADVVRLVTSFETTDAEVDTALTRIEAALTA